MLISRQKCIKGALDQSWVMISHAQLNNRFLCICYRACAFENNHNVIKLTVGSREKLLKINKGAANNRGLLWPYFGEMKKNPGIIDGHSRGGIQLNTHFVP